MEYLDINLQISKDEYQSWSNGLKLPALLMVGIMKLIKGSSL